MRSLPAAVLTAGALLVGCGGSGADVTFTAPSGTEDGKPAVEVANADEASELCEAAQEEWPAVYEETGADAITFDVPDQGGEEPDLICARP